MELPDPPSSLNPKQALFIRELAFGKHKSQKAAAIAAGYAPGRAVVTGSAILRRPDARSYYDSLTGTVADEVAKNVSMDMIDLAEYHVQILKSKPSQAGPDNPLCDIYPTREGEVYVFPKKMDSARALFDILNRDNEKSESAGLSLLETLLSKRDV
jgi:hypothetical protein